MPKVGVAPIRKKQLIEAVIDCIHDYGLQQTTIVKVGQKAGVSPSIVSYYFGDKSSLLMATMRHILSEHQTTALQKIRQANTPMKRIDAIIDANFDNLQIEPKVVSAWLSFWQQARHDEQFARLQRVNNKRLYSNLLVSCRYFHDNEADAKISAEGIAALIDGVWLRSVLQHEQYVSYEKKIIRTFVQARLIDKASHDKKNSLN